MTLMREQTNNVNLVGQLNKWCVSCYLSNTMDFGNAITIKFCSSSHGPQ